MFLPFRKEGPRIIPQQPHPVFKEFFYKYRTRITGFKPHSHSQYEVYYFHSGQCDYWIGDKIFRLQPGDLIIMNGMTKHCPIVNAQVDYVRTMFAFEPASIQLFGKELHMLDPLKPFEVLRNYHIRLTGKQRWECEDILRRVDQFQHMEDRLTYNRFLLTFFDLLLFLAGLCRSALEHYNRSVSDKERHVQGIITYIEQYYTDEEISLEQMEHDLHMSKYHLTKIFREVMNMTIFDYLYRRRISQAKILFTHFGEYSVTDVCQQVGFKHLAHFSRLFKDHVGLPPGHYRKRLPGE